MRDCNHEEADTRMLVHVEHSLVNGATSIGINSEDTDVLIILLGFFHQLQSKYNFSDVVIDLSHTKRYSVSTLAEKLGTSICQALPFFHALTGNETTSAFKNIGKKTAYEVMIKVLPDIQSTFSTFFFHPFKEITKDSPESSNLLSCFTLEPQHTHQSMICISKEHITWKEFPLQQMHYCSIQKGQSIKQGFGQHLCSSNKVSHLPLTLVRSAMIQTHTGNHNGFPREKPVRNVESL